MNIRTHKNRATHEEYTVITHGAAVVIKCDMIDVYHRLADGEEWWNNNFRADPFLNTLVKGT